MTAEKFFETWIPHPKGIKLSPQELKILKMVMCGTTSKDISHKLGIAFATVNTHRANIARKLHGDEDFDITRFPEKCFPLWIDFTNDYVKHIVADLQDPVVAMRYAANRIHDILDELSIGKINLMEEVLENRNTKSV